MKGEHGGVRENRGEFEELDTGTLLDKKEFE